MQNTNKAKYAKASLNDLDVRSVKLKDKIWDLKCKGKLVDKNKQQSVIDLFSKPINQ